MLDIGWTELLVIGIILIVVVGPKDLPPMLRAFGRMTGTLRRMAGDFRTQFDEALRETEMDEVRKTIADAQKLNPSNALRDAINPLRQMGQDIRTDLEKSTRVETTSAGDKQDVEAQKAVEGVVPAEQPAPVTVPAPTMTLPSTPPAVAGPAAPVTGEGAKPAPVKSSRKKASSKAAGADVQPQDAGKRKRRSAAEAPAVTSASKPSARTRSPRKTDTPKDDA
ncbi:twin-arginine translocase subunit TatB [Pseudorhizobium endolithicum]|uniref:Sec-independent protein translocase protein TatB n=1 Tax=Pseudorhizobium endolithicum TaxID=1191678 RepID=A0ABM8PSX1_9HYPH|nr:Sec-independent protein translocase protein TatB [Pseudorhizobium endolithicum]CAD7046618.1 twin-arginine translocase subunit TatB [Pseudorhizobium endolithicum]